MSTILKALRRLEEEKSAAEEARPLREQIASTPHSARRDARRGWLAAIVALVVGVGTGGSAIWWLFGGEGSGTDAAAHAPQAPPTVASVAVPVVTAPPPAQELPPGPPDHAFASDVEIVNRPDALPRLADSEPVAPTETAPEPGSQRPVESSSAAARARQAAIDEMAAAEAARLASPPALPSAPPPEVQIAEVAETPAPVVAAPPAPAQPEPPAPRIQRAARRERAAAAAPVAAKPAPKPVATEPAPEVVAARPGNVPKPVAAPPKPAKPAEPPPSEAIGLEVEKTQWHPLAERRIAWLRVEGESEARQVVEGDVVSGLLVEKIEPSGVVFERDGQQIHGALGKR